MLLYIQVTLFPLLEVAAAQCSRSFLQNVTDSYVAAQAAGRISLLTSLASNASYSENDKVVDIKTGVLSQPLKLDHNRSIHDTVECRTFTELISAHSEHPYVIGTRIVLTGDKITTIESIVTDAGDWAFNATGYLYWDSTENWDPIPEGQRDSREVVKAAGDAYFNKWNNATVNIPLGTPCARLEGGAYTGAGNLTADTCDIGGFPVNTVVTNRRYVVDEVMGSVDIFLGFPGLDRAYPQDPMPDSHLFRVQRGQVRYIHTVSACESTNCGLNYTTPPSRVRRKQRGLFETD